MIRALAIAAALLSLAGQALAAPISTYPLGSAPYTGAETAIATQGSATVQLTAQNIAAAPLPSGLTAALPACTNAQTGARRVVTDASYPAYLTPVTGGGTVVAQVGCNGTAWIVGF